jgi:magnesium transporter
MAETGLLPADDRTVRGQEVAASHLVTRVPTAAPDESVAVVRARLPAGGHDLLDAVYVVGDGGRLRGVVGLRTLLEAAGDTLIGGLVAPRCPRVGPDVDQEHVALAALEHGLAAVPVVDGQDRLLGVVPPQALIAILYQEHAEDLHRLAGIRREFAQAQTAIEAPPLRQAHDRLPWLLVGLLGSVVATAVVARFERALEARMAIAFFIPGIVYLADAIGTQTEAVVVRGLSLSRASLRELLAHELGTGLLIGLALGALTYPAVLLAFDDPGLALAVSLALVAAGTVATSIGLLLPWMLGWLGSDPAFGSGPLATVVQDVVSLLIYLAMASWLVA